jgi:hypothetical protein
MENIKMMTELSDNIIINLPIVDKDINSDKKSNINQYQEPELTQILTDRIYKGILLYLYFQEERYIEFIYESIIELLSNLNLNNSRYELNESDNSKIILIENNNRIKLWIDFPTKTDSDMIKYHIRGYIMFSELKHSMIYGVIYNTRQGANAPSLRSHIIGERSELAEGDLASITIPFKLYPTQDWLLLSESVMEHNNLCSSMVDSKENFGLQSWKKKFCENNCIKFYCDCDNNRLKKELSHYTAKQDEIPVSNINLQYNGLNECKKIGNLLSDKNTLPSRPIQADISSKKTPTKLRRKETNTQTSASSDLSNSLTTEELVGDRSKKCVESNKYSRCVGSSASSNENVSSRHKSRTTAKSLQDALDMAKQFSFSGPISGKELPNQTVKTFTTTTVNGVPVDSNNLEEFNKYLNKLIQDSLPNIAEIQNNSQCAGLSNFWNTNNSDSKGKSSTSWSEFENYELPDSTSLDIDEEEDEVVLLHEPAVFDISKKKIMLMKLPELKIELKKNKLNINGKKLELQERLITYYNL